MVFSELLLFESIVLTIKLFVSTFVSLLFILISLNYIILVSLSFFSLKILFLNIFKNVLLYIFSPLLSITSFSFTNGILSLFSISSNKSSSFVKSGSKYKYYSKFIISINILNLLT